MSVSRRSVVACPDSALPFVAAVLLGWSAGARVALCAIACDALGALAAAGQPWTIRAAEGRHS
jgi:hypothetical protein